MGVVSSSGIGSLEEEVAEVRDSVEGGRDRGCRWDISMPSALVMARRRPVKGLISWQADRPVWMWTSGKGNSTGVLDGYVG